MKQMDEQKPSKIRMFFLAFMLMTSLTLYVLFHVFVPLSGFMAAFIRIVMWTLFNALFHRFLHVVAEQYGKVVFATFIPNKYNLNVRDMKLVFTVKCVYNSRASDSQRLIAPFQYEASFSNFMSKYGILIWSSLMQVYIVVMSIFGVVFPINSSDYNLSLGIFGGIYPVVVALVLVFIYNWTMDVYEGGKDYKEAQSAAENACKMRWREMMCRELGIPNGQCKGDV